MSLMTGRFTDEAVFHPCSTKALVQSSVSSDADMMALFFPNTSLGMRLCGVVVLCAEELVMSRVSLQ